MPDVPVIAPSLLAWYDLHARDLPWRAGPHETRRADPYHVWLSEVMLQQTTVAAVKDYFHRFTTRWPDVAALAAADERELMAEWAGLGYYARARNLHRCAQILAAEGFPQTQEGLIALPGIGPYSSAAIAAIAFDEPATVVDGNVERVVSRLMAVRTPLPAARPELRRLAAALTPRERPGDYAQAMMDLGATICTPRSPRCLICPLREFCAAARLDIAAQLPARAPKQPKPRREGIAWVGWQDGAVLLERRPAKGLLGGTLAFPSSGWDGSDLPPPALADWVEAGHVRHVFTHFELSMQVMVARLDTPPIRGTMVARAEFAPRDLPGLMRKVWTRAEAALPEAAPAALHPHPAPPKNKA